MPKEKNVPLRFAAAYIRVSSDDQLEYSPDSQLKLIREHARREGYVIADKQVFQDDGISGKSASKRPAFRLMIAQAKETPAPFEVIFVWKYSRFARNQEEAIMYKNLLKKNGIEVHSISEPSSDSPYSSLIERIIEWMDEYYLINLAEEVRRGMREKASRGEVVSGAPYGYKMAGNTYSIDEEKAKVVRYIYNRYAEGAGYRVIKLELEDMGIKTVRGNPPTVHMVDYILHNPAYIGKIRWSEDGRMNHKQVANQECDNDSIIYVDGKHEAIIDLQTWEQVQARLGKRQTEAKYRRKHSDIFMLKGIIRCSNCNATLTPQRNKNGTSLQCHKYSCGNCTVSHSIRMEKANALTVSGLESILEMDSYQFTQTNKPTVAVVTQDWDKLIAVEQAKLSRAKTAYLAGVFDVDEFGAIKAETEKTIAKLRAKKIDTEEPEEPCVDISAFHKKVLQVLEILKSDNADDRTKNEALRSILDRIVYFRAENRFDFFFVP